MATWHSASSAEYRGGNSLGRRPSIDMSPHYRPKPTFAQSETGLKGSIATRAERQGFFGKFPAEIRRA